MTSFELIEFTNYDIKKDNYLISDIYSNNNKEFILYQNIMINKNYTIPIKDMSYENVITINLYDLIKDIESTYLTIDEAQYQFKLDISRSHMTLNGHKVIDPESVIQYLECNYRQSNPTLEKEILMLSTQAIFAIPFCFIQKSVQNKGLHLSEISSTDSECLQYAKKYKLDVIDGHISLEKYLRLFSLTETMDSITEYVVKMNIEINLIKDRFFILSFHFIDL